MKDQKKKSTPLQNIDVYFQFLKNFIYVDKSTNVVVSKSAKCDR